MKHDLGSDPDSSKAAEFLNWLEDETVFALKRDYGIAEAAKATIFLFTNRAYESRMTEEQVAQLFGKCVAKADWPESDFDVAFDVFEQYAQIARNVHRET